MIARRFAIAAACAAVLAACQPARDGSPSPSGLPPRRRRRRSQGSRRIPPPRQAGRPSRWRGPRSTSRMGRPPARTIPGRSQVTAGPRSCLEDATAPTVFSDVWTFDLESDAWEQLDASGPAARFGHEAVWVDGIGLVVFAGQSARRSSTTSGPWILTQPPGNGFCRVAMHRSRAMGRARRWGRTRGYGSAMDSPPMAHASPTPAPTTSVPARGPIRRPTASKPVERCLPRLLVDQ